jgi:hypothetical protein
MLNYPGKPYHDEKWPGGPQRIPGRVMCAYYDAGGEGTAYHDADAVNHGSGELNPPDGTYLHNFRKDEGVDTSYVKYRGEKFPDPIDDSPYNLVVPEKDMLYVGWTEPGEWINYTVEVEKDGTYAVELMYTSNAGGKIGLDIDGREAALCPIKTTFVAADPLGWRQWHHWNKLPIAELSLTRGLHLLTIRVLEQGNMNFAYLDFLPRG